jgi:alpha-ketoglutaric semialdehyde dehydrogenase
VLAQGGPASAPCGGQAVLLGASASTFLAAPELAHEVFGPCGLVVRCADVPELERVLASLPGQLTATLHASDAELAAQRRVLHLLERRSGRVIVGGFPTGVEVCHAMQHGGPYPSTTDPRFTSVGTSAVLRFARPVCYQGVPEPLLPEELQSNNPRGILRLIDGASTRQAC